MITLFPQLSEDVRPTFLAKAQRIAVALSKQKRGGGELVNVDELMDELLAIPGLPESFLALPRKEQLAAILAFVQQDLLARYG